MKIEEKLRNGEGVDSPERYHSECGVHNTQLWIYRRAIMPTIPARRPAAGLTLEAAPVKGTLEEPALGWEVEG
jgi:hypothetical protein